MCEPEPPPPSRLFCFLFLLLPRHLTGFILLRSMHKRFHIMLIVPFVVVYSKSCPGHCGSQGREKEKTRTGKLWLSFSLHLLSVYCVPLCVCRYSTWNRNKKQLGKHEKTQNPGSWGDVYTDISMESAIAVCAHYNNATWNRNNNNNWEEFENRPQLKPCRMFLSFYSTRGNKKKNEFLTRKFDQHSALLANYLPIFPISLSLSLSFIFIFFRFFFREVNVIMTSIILSPSKFGVWFE